jgi:hypothetical protein
VEKLKASLKEMTRERDQLTASLKEMTKERDHLAANCQKYKEDLANEAAFRFNIYHSFVQCCGSVTFWCGFGSGDHYL